MTQTNKQLVLEHMNRVNAGDLAGAAALMAEDCVNHSAVPEAQGRKGFITILEKLRTAFPDMQSSIEDVLADGDRVMVRTTFKGTNRGPLTFIRFAHEPTGKAVSFEQIHISRVADGRIVEHWLSTDAIAMFRQLGFKFSPTA